VLDERRDIIELREPGVAACPRCGALHGSDARFCPQCGTQFSGPLAMVEVGGIATPAPEAAPTIAQEPPAVSAAELGATPVSGALEGNPPPEAPPVVEESPAEESPAEGQASAAEAPTTVGETPAPDDASAGEPSATAPASDQPTQVLPAVDSDSNGGHSFTSGDPLAQRERPES
jgi:ribosomal protein L40E